MFLFCKLILPTNNDVEFEGIMPLNRNHFPIDCGHIQHLIRNINLCDIIFMRLSPIFNGKPLKLSYTANGYIADEARANVHGDTVEVEIWSRSPQTCPVMRGPSSVSSFLSATFTHANPLLL